jgi:hypothetical protein
LACLGEPFIGDCETTLFNRCLRIVISLSQLCAILGHLI